MPSTLPLIDGYHEPTPLREFLRRFFALHVVALRLSTDIAQPNIINSNNNNIATMQLSQRAPLSLPPTAFSTFVYVAIGAPPPPAINPSTASSRPVVQVASMAAGHHVLSKRCLAHPSWEILFHALGAQGAGFVLAHCALVVQFAPGEGGLQILGRSLCQCVARSSTSDSPAGQRSGERDKRTRSSMMFPSWDSPTAGKRRRLEMTKIRVEQNNSGGRRRSLAAVLGSQNVSRLPLLFMHQRFWTNRTIDLASNVQPRRTRLGGVDLSCALQFMKTVIDAAQELRATRRAREGSSPEQHTHISLMNDLIDHTRSQLLGHNCAKLKQLFPVTLGAGSTTLAPHRQQQPPSHPTKLMILLAEVASQLLAQTALANTTGASILAGGAHTRTMPTQGEPKRTAPIHLRASASVAVVTKYLRRVLGAFRWSGSGAGGDTLANKGMDGRNNDAAASPPPTSRVGSFWDQSIIVPHRRSCSGSRSLAAKVATSTTTTAVVQLGTPSHTHRCQRRKKPKNFAQRMKWKSINRNINNVATTSNNNHHNDGWTTLDALLITIGQWLRFGKRGTFPLHLFMDRVHVNSVPWLAASRCGVGATQHNEEQRRRGSDEGSEKQQRRSNKNNIHQILRGKFQQRLWMEVCKLLVEGPIVYLLCTSFRVTWSPKAPSALLFYHSRLFHEWEKLELSRVVAAAAAAHSGSHHKNKNPPQQPNAATTTTHDEPLSASSSSPLPLPMHLVPVTAKRHVWRRGRGSPLHCMQQLYSFHHLLPDGKKLRPVATIRYGTVDVLQTFARRWQRRRGREEVKTATTASAGVAAVVQPQRTCCKKPPAPPISHKLLPPNRAILRDCLAVLSFGVDERRRNLGQCVVSHRGHDEEYMVWREFVAACCSRRRSGRQCAAECDNTLPPLASTPIFVVRGDASRCFDRLPQDKLVSAVHSLMPHSVYHRLCLDAIAPVTSSIYGSSTLQTEDVAVHERVMMNRVWSTIVSDHDFQRGVLCKIPPRWIVTEAGASPLRDRHHHQPRNDDDHNDAIETGGSTSGFASESLNGAYLRQVLIQHVERHYAVVCGRLYEQHNGITQGSAVATLLCDALLTDSVDQCLAGVLEQYDASSTLLRRVDDVLIATTSSHASAACDAAVRSGWLVEAGYIRNPEKSHAAATAAAAAADCHEEKEATTTTWCGLSWNLQSLEFSIDWTRLLGTNSLHSCRLRPSIRPRTECNMILTALRVVGVLQIRSPLTVFCAILNSKPRVLQTVGEVCRVFAESLVSTCVASLPFLRLHVRCLLRPLAVALSAMRRHCRKRDEELKQRKSYSACSAEEFDAILWLTVLHAWQERRRRQPSAKAAARSVTVGEGGAHPDDERHGQNRSTAAALDRQTKVLIFWKRMTSLLKLKSAAALSRLSSDDARRMVIDSVRAARKSVSGS